MPGPRPSLPPKRYFRIGEVCELTGLKAHVLRYWETEFKQIGPRKTKSNQRLYRKKDVEAILRVKHLLYDRRFTIPGARAIMDGRKEEAPEGTAVTPSPRQLAIEFDPAGRDELLDKMIAELTEVRALLDNRGK